MKTLLILLLCVPRIVFAQSGVTSATAERTSFHPPYYGLTRLESFVDSVAAFPLVERIHLGQSVQGRDIEMLIITDPSVPDSLKKTVWQQFRVHGNEDEQNYIMEGAIEFLLSEDPGALAPEMLQRLIYIIIPVINPDGVVLNQRGNVHGIDLNRNWVDSTDHALEEPEIRAVHDALDDWVLNKGNRIYFALDMHGWSSSRDGGYRTYANVAGEAYAADQVTFLTILTGLSPWIRISDWNFSTGHTRMSRLALLSQHGLNIMTSETTGGNRWDGTETTVENLQEEGADFVTAIYHYLYHVHFVTSMDEDAETYALSDSLFIRLDDRDANGNPAVIEEYEVLLTSSSLDTETVLLSEIYSAAGVFTNDDGIALTAATPVPGDGIVQVHIGDFLSVFYQDVDFADDFCRDEARVVESSGFETIADAAGPVQFILKQNYPNPFNGTTRIDFFAGSARPVTVTIYDLLGKEVKTLLYEPTAPGVYSTYWDATDEFGNRVSSGVYLYSLVSGDVRVVKKLVLVQ